MRAIIIDDKDAKALLQQLELAKLKATADHRVLGPYQKDDVPYAIEHVHSWFKYYVCKWLQDQGAHVT